MWGLLLALLLQFSGPPTGCPESGWTLGIWEPATDSVYISAHGTWRHWHDNYLVLNVDSMVVRYFVDFNEAPEYVTLRIYILQPRNWWKHVHSYRMTLKPLHCEYSVQYSEQRVLVFSCLHEFLKKEPDIKVANASWQKH